MATARRPCGVTVVCRGRTRPLAWSRWDVYEYECVCHDGRTVDDAAGGLGYARGGLERSFVMFDL